MSADIRLIATDLDGTLLDENGEVSPANAEALADAVAAGITVCIATGRSHASASRFARELGIATYSAHGGAAQDSHRLTCGPASRK